MKTVLQNISFVAVAMLFSASLWGQNNLAVERFVADENSQTARITEKRTDQNNKTCAIIKIETSLLLQDFSFDAGMTAVAHTEQKTGEVWLWLSPGARRLTISHKYLGTVRNYEFVALKEATVYIMKLKSGTVKTVIDVNVALQYFVVECPIEGATINIDTVGPKPFVNEKFQEQLSYGRHKYTIEAPLYHPLSGIAEIIAEKQTLLQVELKPAFGKLTVNSQPEQGADVFIDGEKRGQTPLTVDKMRSGEHTVRIIKNLFFSATEKTVVSDGETVTMNVTMNPNFADLTFKADGDIYVNDELKATGTWTGRLSAEAYKVEVRKISHRPTVTTVTAKAGETRTINLDAPTPVYGSLDVKANVYATIFVDNVKHNTSPFLINRLLIGKHEIMLQADGYQTYKQTVEVTEGKIANINAILQELPKTATLKIDANIISSVDIKGKYAGNTPKTLLDLPLGRTEVTFYATGYKTLNKTINLEQGYNEIYGRLKQKKEAKSKFFVEYVYSKTAPLGLSLGYCKRWGGYMQFKTSPDVELAFNEISGKAKFEPETFSDIDFNKKRYSRLALTVGVMSCIFEKCYLYAGLGYGSYGATYKMVENNIYYCPDLQKGVEAEGGVKIVLWDLLSLSAGYNTIFSSNSQRFADVHLGIGFSFGKK
jgi:hypothetical protein